MNTACSLTGNARSEACFGRPKSDQRHGSDMTAAVLHAVSCCIGLCYRILRVFYINRGVFCQKQVSGARTSNYIPQILWNVITCSCPWYLLLVEHCWVDEHIRYTVYPQKYMLSLCCVLLWPGDRFTIKTPSYQQWDLHNKDETVMRPSYIYNGNPYITKSASVYCIGLRVSTCFLLGDIRAPAPWCNPEECG